MKSKVVYWGLQVAQQTKTLKLWPNDCKFESQVILLLHQQPESESTIPIALITPMVVLVSTGICWLLYWSWGSGAFLKVCWVPSDAALAAIRKNRQWLISHLCLYLWEACACPDPPSGDKCSLSECVG